MNTSRRKFVVSSAVATAGAATLASAQHKHGGDPAATGDITGSGADKHVGGERHGETAPGARVVPVEGPDLQKLPFEMDGDVKVFRLRGTVTKREFLPGKVVNVWGFNDQMPGPILEAVEGDRVRIIVENALPEDFTMHWHGLEIPPAMDGIPGLTQDPIPPGGTFTYEFDLNQNGTYFYHTHMAMQEMMGMLGPFIIHPKVAFDPPVDRDFVLVWQEWAILPNNDTPNTMAMEFNWLTMNGKTGPDATPMLAKVGERIRVRNINIGMDHHPIHLHNAQFVITGTEAGRKPQRTWFKENTVILGVAQARDLEFTGDRPVDHMLHCHLPHHMMNGMASMVGPMMGVGKGLDADAGMNNGMGMLTGGSALSENYGPSFGRTIGTGATADEATTSMAVTKEGAKAMAGEPTASGEPPVAAGAATGMAGMAGHHHTPGMQMGPATTASGQGGPQTNANDVSRQMTESATRGEAPEAPRRNGMIPGYPQDMAMEMDAIVAKPETHGLRAGWTMGMMGMMTLVRVLPPETYDEIVRMRETWTPTKARLDAQKRAQSTSGQTGAPATPHQHKHD